MFVSIHNTSQILRFGRKFRQVPVAGKNLHGTDPEVLSSGENSEPRKASDKSVDTYVLEYRNGDVERTQGRVGTVARRKYSNYVIADNPRWTLLSKSLLKSNDLFAGYIRHRSQGPSQWALIS